MLLGPSQCNCIVYLHCRRNNLAYVDDDTLVMAAGNRVVFLNVNDMVSDCVERTYTWGSLKYVEVRSTCALLLCKDHTMKQGSGGSLGKFLAH